MIDMGLFVLAIDFESLCNTTFYGEPLESYLKCVGIIILTLLLQKWVAARVSRLSSSLSTHFIYDKHKQTLKEMLYMPTQRVVQIVLYYLASNQLTDVLERIVVYRVKAKHPTVTLGDVTDKTFLFLFIIFFCHFVAKFADFIFYIRFNKAQEEKNNNQLQLIPLLREITKLSAWTLAVFWILGSVFSVNIPALITGLGIGGIAIALASKETVENIFAAFTLLSDKPFQTNDVIKAGDTEGTVERIGFRSTRIRNFDGSCTIVPNQKLVGQNVTNLSTRERRGIKLIANIRYGIDAPTLSLITTTLQTELPQLAPVKEGIDITLETLDKETMQLIVVYLLPHPLPEGMKLLEVKHATNSKIFEIISRHAQLGTPPAASAG
ncbi:MAG: mechanosensitive ion channel family protein [Chitinophagia bacterium]|nr:mechanosensitive ion channel family protein [Chitinophagia bacterium]